jgi:hypothetical protein
MATDDDPAGRLSEQELSSTALLLIDSTRPPST